MMAKLNMVKTLLAKSSLEVAWRASIAGEQPNGVSKELNDQMRQLSHEIEKRRADKRYGEADREQQDAQARQKAEYDKFMQQRRELDAKRKADAERFRRQQQ